MSSASLRLVVAVFCNFSATAPAAQAPAQESKVPGIVIDYSPARSRQYIGSPSLAVLPNGDYVASHDFFGPGSTRDETVVFVSADKGRTWNKRATIRGQWWSTLFIHQNSLYLMGTSKEYGAAVIRRSKDGGATWTVPADKYSGLLLADGKYHCAPVPVVVHAGRIWRAMEDAMGTGGWGQHFRAFMMSAPVDADLLKAASWTCSNRLPRNPDWLDGKFGGWLEGNAVVTPEGKIVDILRVDHRPIGDWAAMVSVSDDGTKAEFDPANDFVRFPGGAKKFTIRFDPESKSYWSLANPIVGNPKFDNASRVRNTLALLRSKDLRSWDVRAIIVHHPDTEKHGYQYVDWLFDGPDLIAVVRTAHDNAADGAHNQHDANYMTFLRVKNFRTLVTKQK